MQKNQDSNPTTSLKKTNFILKKQFFIASRQDDIRKYYQFVPKFLGRGAYGIVYRAKMIKAPFTERAVKIIPKSLIKNPQNLQNQIAILKKLDHPNIIKLYETFEDSEHFYLVLDFCEGGQLFNRLAEKGKFNEEDARNIFIQIIKILKYLHSQKICHRDLKPQNFLMFSKDSFQIKLIDFGLSFEFQSNMKQELKSKKKNKLVGTSYYIAPELINFDYDQRCDIWSAGVILYILSTASPPFDGLNDNQILRNVAKGNYSLESSETQKLSPQLKDLIMNILKPEKERFTLDQILSHPWMSIKLIDLSLELDFKKLKKFCNYTKLKTIAVTYIASQLPQKQIHRLGQIFKQIDQNNDGYLTLQELKHSLERQKNNTSLVELTSILSNIDTDKNGRINYNQFVACCLEKSILNNQTYLQYAFKTFDKDNNGTISKGQFKQILQKFNMSNPILGTYIEQILEGCDKDHDGQINYMEFLQSLGYNRGKSPSSDSRSSHNNSHLSNSYHSVQNSYESHSYHSPSQHSSYRSVHNNNSQLDQQQSSSSFNQQ